MLTRLEMTGMSFKNSFWRISSRPTSAIFEISSRESLQIVGLASSCKRDRPALVDSSAFTIRLPFIIICQFWHAFAAPLF